MVLRMSNPYFSAMEHFPAGALDAYINASLKENDVRDIASQLIVAIDIMHSEGFTHRDLRPYVS